MEALSQQLYESQIQAEELYEQKLKEARLEAAARLWPDVVEFLKKESDQLDKSILELETFLKYLQTKGVYTEKDEKYKLLREEFFDLIINKKCEL